MDKQNPPQIMHSQTTHPWKILLASLLTVGVTGTVWAGEGDGERIRIEKKVINRPCSDFNHEGEDTFGMAVRSRGFLGVELTQLTPELRRHFGVPEDVGVMVGKVVDDSAAFRAGLAVGDIISRADGEEVSGAWELTSVIRKKKGNSVVDLEYWREGHVNQVSVTLDEKEGCVFDLGSTVHRLEELGEHLPEIQMHGLRISEEAMSEAMEALRSIDWEEHLQGLENLEIDFEMEEQMEALQEQMIELKKRLAKESIHFEKEMKESMKDRQRALKDHHKARIQAEKSARKEMIRAQKEARRAMEEAHRNQAEMAREMKAEERELAEEIRREAEEARHEAMRAAHEAEREARRAAEEAEQEGGGSLLI